MNRCYRLVRNARTGLHVPVPETARAHGSGGRRARIALSIAGLVLGAAAASAGAADLPTGGQVVAGTGTISQSGTAVTVVQGSQRLVTNWQSFDIGAGRSVAFVQPSSSAVALARVLGGSASRIEGALTANGQLFLVNPNGILFAPGARIDVGGLVASTLSITDADFMADRYRFEGTGGPIVNAGRIAARDGGTIALIAARIVNDGQVSAPSGSVLMGAGSRVTLDLGGPARLEVERGVLDALVRNGGAISADGGRVFLTAKAADVLSSAVVSNAGVIEARTLVTGEKGEIRLIADMSSGRLEVGGRIDASAPNGGDGGLVETSGAHVALLSGLAVDAGAARGAGGQWLVDPYDITIGTSQAATISGSLSSGTSVTLQTTSVAGLGSTGTSASPGDVTIGAAISKTGGGAATFRVLADRNIYVNAPITSTAGALNIDLLAANAAGATSGGVRINGNLDSNGGAIRIGGGATNGGAFAAVSGIGYARNLGASNPAVEITAGASSSSLRTIRTRGGDLTINGWSSIAGSGGSYQLDGSGIYIGNDSLISAGTGTMSLTGRVTGFARYFGIGFQGGSGTSSTLEAGSTGGTILLSAWNTTGATNNDTGAFGLMNNGNAEQVQIGARSVANVLPLINGSPSVATFTQAAGTCQSGGPYTNCGGMQVPGTNGSYLYASYNAVTPETAALYLWLTGSKTYDGMTAATGATVSQTYGGPGGFTAGALGSLSFATPSRNAGSYSSLLPTGPTPSTYASGGTSYAVGYFGGYTVSPRTVTPVASDKVYDGSAAASIGIQAGGLIPGDQVTLSSTGGSFASANVARDPGTGAPIAQSLSAISGISLAGADAGNYVLSTATLAGTTATILPGEVTVSGARAYDGTTVIGASTLTVGNLAGAQTLQLIGTGAVASANAGGGAQALSLGTLALADGTGGATGLASNYTLVASGSTATIVPRIVDLSGNRVYDRTTDAAASAFTGFGNLTGGQTLTLSGVGSVASMNASGTPQAVNLGTLALADGTSGTVGLASNYTLTGGMHRLTVTPRPLTVAALDRVYDGTTDATLSLAGVLVGDAIGVSSNGASFASADRGTHAVTAASVALSGTQSGNYSMTGSPLAGVTATIQRRPVSVTGARHYDGTADFVPGTLVIGNLVGTQTLATTGVGTVTSPDAGSAPQSMTVTGLALADGSNGGLADNYTLTGGTHAGAISPRVLGVSGVHDDVDGASKS